MDITFTPSNKFERRAVGEHGARWVVIPTKGIPDLVLIRSLDGRDLRNIKRSQLTGDTDG